MKTAVCLVVRNGRQDIVEWIAYHATIGFDTIFVFDNGSSDGTQDIARSTAKLHDVRVNPWSEHGSTAKRDCYNNFLLNYGSLYDWVGFIDIDEFIMPLQDASITEFLRKFDGYPAIALNWAIFGSNGFRVPPSGLIIETYTKRSDRHFPSNRHVKSIVRPEFVERAKDRYVFELRSLQAEHHGLKWSYYVDSLGRPIEWSADGNTIASLPELEVCRVNHYYTRSRADFDVKMLHKDWLTRKREIACFTIMIVMIAQIFLQGASPTKFMYLPTRYGQNTNSSLLNMDRFPLFRLGTILLTTRSQIDRKNRLRHGRLCSLLLTASRWTWKVQTSSKPSLSGERLKKRPNLATACT